MLVIDADDSLAWLRRSLPTMSPYVIMFVENMAMTMFSTRLHASTSCPQWHLSRSLPSSLLIVHPGNPRSQCGTTRCAESSR